MEALSTKTEAPTTGDRKQTSSPLKNGATLKKVSGETAKLIQQIKDRANRKNFGRRVRDEDVLALAVRLLTPEHVKLLQDASLNERDRLNLLYADYQKSHTKTTLDQFIGMLLRGEISTKLTTSNTPANSL